MLHETVTGSGILDNPPPFAKLKNLGSPTMARRFNALAGEEFRCEIEVAGFGIGSPPSVIASQADDGSLDYRPRLNRQVQSPSPAVAK
jgi:hypothetical protein